MTVRYDDTSARNIVCHAKGHSCLGCVHHEGVAPVCIFAPKPEEKKPEQGAARAIQKAGNDQTR